MKKKIIAAHTDGIYVKFDMEDAIKPCRETPSWIKIGQKYRGVYVQT